MSDFFLRTPKDPNNPLHDGKPSEFWGQGENDLKVDVNGDFALDSGIDLLKQAMAKILVTVKETNTLFPAYGSGLQDLIGQNIDIEFLRGKIKSEIIDALRVYQFINTSNPNLDEQVDILNRLEVTQILSDGIQVQFDVTTQSGKRVGSFVVEV